MHWGFEIDIPVGARHVMRLLENDLHHAYIVGGCVRDSLLGKEPNDWDICTSAKPGEVLALMGSHGVRTIETGLQHGTVTACWGFGNYEITTFRVDGEYSDKRRPDSVEFISDVAEDLARRDFTINAMAYSEREGLVDPWGGYGDLDNKLIRCVGNPDDRFQEDALRILRALRFASVYGFKIEEKTSAAIHRNRYLLNNIAAERIRSELTKMLCGEGIVDILIEYSDVMSVIIPELAPCIGFNQNNPYHMYTVYDHITHAVGNYKGSDISIKMALLLHDIAKPSCYSVDSIDGVTGHFYGHSVPSAHIAKDVTDRLRFDNKTKAEIVELVRYHDVVINPDVRSIKRLMNKIGPEILDKLFRVRTADIYAQSELGRDSRISKCDKAYGIAKYIECDRQCFRIKDLAVNGHDIMSLGVEAGPTVGKVLKHLLDKVLDGALANEYGPLIGEANRYLEDIK